MTEEITTTEIAGEEDARTQEQQQAVNRIRRDLADGFAFVRGREVTDGIAAMTLEEMIAREIQAIEGDESDTRPGRLSEIAQIRQKVDAAVEQALQMPAEFFELREAQESPANTRTDGSGPGDDDE
jgi:hypothetical protein